MTLGCGGGGGGSPNTGGDAAPADAVGSAAQWGGQVEDYDGSGLAGASVCIGGLTASPECTTTDASGNYSVSIVYDHTQTYDVSQTATLAGYLSNRYDFVEHPGFVVNDTPASLMSNDLAATLLGSDAGFTFPSTTTGYLRVRVLTTVGVPVTATIAPLGSGTAGAAPVYGGGDGTPDRTLTAIGSDGGNAYFGNLAPGAYEITFSNGSATSCASPDTLTGSDALSIQVQVLASTLTFADGVGCGIF